MSFVAAATAIGLEGVAATIGAGAMMGATTTVAGNVISGRDPFDNIGRGIITGGITGGLAPGVSEALNISMPMAAGITQGSLTALSTGSLSQGLMAGMGAYGAYGLSQGMASMGEGALSGQMLGDWQANLANQGLVPGTAEYGEAASKLALNAKEAAGSLYGDMSAAEKMSAGFDAAKAAPGTFLKDNFKYLAAAAGPAIMAGQNVQAKAPQTVTKPGMIRPYAYDPYGGTYTAYPAYEAVPTKAAEGGLMGMNAGGYSPGMLDFTQSSEPVVRMANGGIAALAAGGDAASAANPAINSVEDLYTQILGRAPDAGGLAFWKQGFGDTIDANEIASFKQAAQSELANRSAPEQQILAPNLVNTSGTAPAATSVADLYQGILGRAPESSAVTGYWQNQFGDTIDANELAQFKTAAQAELDARKAGTTGGGVANLANTGVTAGGTTGGAAGVTAGGTTGGTDLTTARTQVENMYRNVLGRDADPEGLAFWSNAIASGRSPQSIYNDFLASARSNTELVRADQIKNKTFAEATSPYSGYMSKDTSNIVDEWVRNTLGREVTDADRQQQWYKDAADKMHTQAQAQDLYGQFKTYATKESSTEIANRVRAIDAELKAKGLTDADLLKQTGKTKQQLATEGLNLDLNWMGASQLAPAAQRKAFDLTAVKNLTPLSNTFGGPAIDRTITNPYGNATNPGDLTFNRDGTVTVTPNIPYRPYGGFSGMDEVKNAYTQGGGSLGYVPYAPKTMDEFNAKYNTMTGGSKQAYDYLTGKSAYNPVPYTPTGQIMKPYWESVGKAPENLKAKKYIFKDGKYELNPAYVPPKYVTDAAQAATKTAMLTNHSAIPTDDPGTGNEWVWNSTASTWEAKPIAAEVPAKEGGLMAMARGGTTHQPFFSRSTGKFNMHAPQVYADGGMADHYNLGGYSDGGRLLRGPGDGVSDSIPATIGNKQPARLADGEFVVPARIVSELGNGSTEAGARKLYAMMDRVQAARKGSIGKGKVAKNSRADKYLPA